MKPMGQIDGTDFASDAELDASIERGEARPTPVEPEALCGCGQGCVLPHLHQPLSAVEPDGLPLDVRSDVQHALEAINAALDKASYGDSVESDLFEAHATLDTLLGGTPSEAKP